MSRKLILAALMCAMLLGAHAIDSVDESAT